MSYEIIKNIKFNKKENYIEVNHASNNLRPLYWSKAKYQKENWRETMKVFLRDMIGGEIQPLASCNKYKIYYAKHELKKYQPYIENEDFIWNKKFNENKEYVYAGNYDQTKEQENWDKIIQKFEELYNENDKDKYLIKNIRYGEFKNYEVKRNKLRTKQPEAQDKYTAYYNMIQTMESNWNSGTKYNLEMVNEKEVIEQSKKVGEILKIRDKFNCENIEREKALEYRLNILNNLSQEEKNLILSLPTIKSEEEIIKTNFAHEDNIDAKRVELVKYQLTIDIFLGYEWNKSIYWKYYENEGKTEEEPISKRKFNSIIKAVSKNFMRTGYDTQSTSVGRTGENYENIEIQLKFYSVPEIKQVFSGKLSVAQIIKSLMNEYEKNIKDKEYKEVA